MGGHDAGVGGALAAAARQLPDAAGGVPRALRVQRSRRRQGLHAADPRPDSRWTIPYTVEVRPDTGLNNAKIGIWLFLASEVMLFGALFATYILLRIGAPTWPQGRTILNVPLATFNTVVLIASSVTMVMAWASLMRNEFGKYRLYMGRRSCSAFVFLVVKSFEYSPKFHARTLPEHEQLPRASTSP